MRVAWTDIGHGQGGWEAVFQAGLPIISWTRLFKYRHINLFQCLERGGANIRLFGGQNVEPLNFYDGLPRTRKLYHEDGEKTFVTVVMSDNPREAWALWHLKGVPGVPTLLGVTDHPPRCLITIDYLGSRGVRLDTRLGNLGFKHYKGLQIVCRVARTIHFLHRRGYVHLNLTPRSIIVGNSSAMVTVVDFNCSVYIGDLDSEQQAQLRARDIGSLLNLLGGLRSLYVNDIYRQSMRELFHHYPRVSAATIYDMIRFLLETQEFETMIHPVFRVLRLLCCRGHNPEVFLDDHFDPVCESFWPDTNSPPSLTLTLSTSDGESLTSE